jgi:hypothetical protein
MSTLGIGIKEDGFKITLIQSAKEEKRNTSELKGQGEFLQRILAKPHSRKRWEEDSVAVLQIGQKQFA